MAPTPQEHHHQDASDAETVPDDAIVISGVSGLFPGCDSYLEFGDKLYKKENMIAECNRWKNYSHPDLPVHFGLINNLYKFDAQFFTVAYQLAHSSEPGSRKIFEQTFQALFDSGTCPTELSNKRIGVFLAISVVDSDNSAYSKDVQLGLIGNSRSIFANRISFWLNLKGPSMTIDGEACGTVTVIEQACQAIKKGHCEAAIVGSAKILLHPQFPVIYNREFGVNPDGKTKCYDANADGQSLSEAVNIMFLQKHKHAKRVYAVIRHAKAEYSLPYQVDTSGLFKIPRDLQTLTNFYQTFYEEAGVAPSSVQYVEGFGAANHDMDKLELQALEQVFCQDRQEPLLVGSVTSNIGYTETATAACGILKVLLAYQRGVIPATINCSNPRQDVSAIHSGQMRVLTEHAPLLRSHIAVNGFSFTGLNGHVLLQRYGKQKDVTRYHSDIPYLVMASGRQESSVKKILDDLMSRHPDPEEIALLHEIFKNRIGLHMARGIGVFSSTKEETTTIIHSEKVDYYDGLKRPLWFVYSGMGSQWNGMGKHLMRIPLFAESIQRSHKILEPKGIDLINIITTNDDKTFDNILNSFVGISAIQIALTDILTAVGIVPDNIIGHSLGELGCAYADGSLTAEQVVELAYLRGYLSVMTPLDRGAMAAIGLGYKQVSKICPPEIDVACHNSATSCTISGPDMVVKQFVERLTSGGVFAKEVQCSNIAYHSRYIASLGTEFIRQSKLLVPTPKLRSSRWLSSSVPHDRWNEDAAKYSSAEYHTNNLLSTVLFEETLRFVPSNAVLVEIAPHGLLQAILKRALSVDCQHVPLTRRANQDNAVFLLEALGNLYMHGHDPDVTPLYPKMEFPVSSSTRPLSHMVEWVHSEDWKAVSFNQPDESFYNKLNLIISLEDDEYRCLKGHRIEGMCVFPFAACLVSVWDMLCMTLNQERKKLSVQFLNLKFYSQPALFEHQLQYLTVTLQRGTGHFEVYDGKIIVIEGTITSMAKANAYPPVPENATMHLSKEDIYKLFYEKGHEYMDQFRCLQSINSSMTEANIQWNDNWVTFIDAIIQMNALRENHQGISKLNYISRMVIDYKTNFNDRNHKDGLIYAIYDEFQNRTRCGGVSVEHISFKEKPFAKRHEVVLKTLKFVPFYQSENKDISTSMTILIQMIAENKNKEKLTIAYVNLPNKLDYIRKIKSVMHSLPKIELNILFLNVQDILQCKAIEEKPDAVLLHDLISDAKIFEPLYQILPPDTFIISIGVDAKSIPASIYKPVSAIGSGRNKVELAKFKPSPAPSNTTAISIRNVSDIHHLHINCEELAPQHKLLILASYPTPVGLVDQVNRWRKRNNNISMVMFDQRYVMDKELENMPDMPFSVLHNGIWGSEYYVPTTCNPPTTTSMTALRCSRPGDLNSLNWVPVNDVVENHGVDVEVHYAGLTTVDVANALAETPNWSNNEGFGMDFSGVTARGERVMGLLPRGAASNKVRVDPNMLWPVPAHWTMEDAATVPYAYAHAMYCLYIKTWLMPGMNVFIYGGAGALGQASIAIALAHGCQVFTTVNDVRKKRFLKKLFPQLKEQNIGNSRDDTFQFVVRNATNGLGCDIFLSCAKGEMKKKYFTCMALNGNIVDTAQLVTRENIDFEYRFLARQVSYHAVDFSSIFDHGNVKDMKKLQMMLSEGIIRGYVRPLSRVTYAPNETARAFRLLTASRHRGRVLLAMRDRTPVVEPRISCNPASGHVVVYNEEVLGLQVADLLVKRGAKKLFLHGDQTPYLKHKIQLWKEQGVNVKISSANLKNKEETMSLIKHSKSLADVEGIYVVSSNPSSTETVASALTNLDITSRKLCPNLRYFALISENDKPYREIISKRAHDGLPSLSVQLQSLKRFVKSEDLNSEELSGDLSLTLQSAISAVEKALHSGDNTVLAYAQPIVRLSILEEVAKIPGVNITNATVDRTSLEQVGVDHGRAQELCNLLEEKFQIIISPEAVPRMTIGQLKHLKRETEDIERDVPGLWAYLSSFDDDEMVATTDMVVMPTLVHRSELRPDQFDTEHDYLCIVPGLEGHHGRFRTLCERLKIPAAVLQHSHLDKTITETAQRMVNVILKYLKPKRGFNILGYEFGVLVALEIATILESHGYTGTVFMLGATPEDILTSFHERWGNADEETLQDTLLLHLHNLMTRTTCTELGDTLRKTKNWLDKVEVLIKAVRNKVSPSNQYIRDTSEGIYSRIRQLKNYNIQPQRLCSKVVLLQAKPYKSSIHSLKKFSNQEPGLNNLRATYPFVHKDLSCSNIINGYLDPEILEEYEKSNHCQKTVVPMEDIVRLSLKVY